MPGTEGDPSQQESSKSSSGVQHSAGDALYDFSVERLDSCLERNAVAGFWAEVEEKFPKIKSSGI